MVMSSIGLSPEEAVLVRSSNSYKLQSHPLIREEKKKKNVAN
jgi:hypothetical protein